MTEEIDEAALVEALQRAAWVAGVTGYQRLDHGMSGDAVFRLDGARPLYVKVGDPARRISLRELEREIAMLAWLKGRVGAPTVVWSGEVWGRPALVTEAIAGVPSHELPADRAEPGAIAALAALTTLHSLPIASCPFDERVEIKLAEASRRVAMGEVDRDGWESANLGRPIEQVWRQLLASRPAEEDLVVTHGDACWPNFILRPDGQAGIVDLGRAGVADRHQDLALFIRSAQHNYPDLPIRRLVAEHYRLAGLDEQKLEFYRELDEFY